MEHVRQPGSAFRCPPGLGALLTDSRLGNIWLVVRVYVGWQWLNSGWRKLTGPSSIGWVRDGIVGGKAVHSGDKLRGFWQHAVAPAQQGSMSQIGYGWYRAFLQLLLDHHAQHVLAPVIATSEFLVGVLLLLGAFTALAAATGALLNFNYMLAGSASINPVLFLGALLLVVAWRTAGWIGLDRWLLPALGTPWQPGWLVRGRGAAEVPTAPRLRRSRTTGAHATRAAARLARQRRRSPAL